MKIDINKWIPMNKAVELTGMSKGTIKNWALKGVIRYQLPFEGNNLKLYCKQDLLNYLNRK